MNDLEIAQLSKKLDELEKENFRLKGILDDYGITEEKKVSDQEWICVKELERLRSLSEASGLEDKEVAMLDTLTKVLQRERESSKSKKTPKGKKENVDNLLKIASSNDE